VKEETIPTTSKAYYVLLGIVMLWTELPFRWRSDVIFNANFLWGDSAYNLHLVDQLEAGKTLYEGVFSQYGPLGIYTYWMLSKLGGNNPETYFRMFQMSSLLSVLLLWGILVRSFNRWIALIFLIFWVCPFLLVPGGMSTKIVQASYFAVERPLLLWLIFLWRPSWEVRSWRMILPGVIMGLLNLNKFGGGFFALAAWLIVDLFFYLAMKRGRHGVFDGLKKNALMMGTFGLLLLWWKGYLLLSISPQIARDVFWPAYMVENYASYLDSSISALSFFKFISWGEFIFFQFFPWVCLAAFLISGVLCFKQLRNGVGKIKNQEMGAFLFGGCFFLLSLNTYIAHQYSCLNFLWLLAFSAGLGAVQFKNLPMGLALLNLPMIVTSLVMFVVPTGGHGLVSWQFPRGGSLWVTKVAGERIKKIQATVDELIGEKKRETGRDDIVAVAFSMNAGWCHYFGWGSQTRHAWFLHGFLRPYEEESWMRALERTAAVVVVGDKKRSGVVTRYPVTWPVVGLPILSDENQENFVLKLGEPITIDDDCWIFPIRNEKIPVQTVK
jgi:hypothetical protein